MKPRRRKLIAARFDNAPDLGKVSHLCVGQFGARDTRGISLYEELFGDPCRRRPQSKTHQSRHYGGYGAWIIIVGDPQRCVNIIRRWQEEVGLTTVFIYLL